MDGADEERLPDLAHGRREPDQAQLERCPGCYEYKPVSEFCELVSGLEHDAIEPMCQSCRDNGIPQVKFSNLNRRHLKVAKCLLGGNNPAQGVKMAAEATGFSESYIRELRAGRRLPEFRRYYQMYLEQAGGDIATVARVQVACMNEATEQKWNPKEEDFNEFPDWRTRLRASQHVGKMLEMEPPKQDGVNVGVAIKIETNLGDGETIDPPNVLRSKVDAEAQEAPLVVDFSHVE